MDDALKLWVVILAVGALNYASRLSTQSTPKTLAAGMLALRALQALFARIG